MNGWRIYYLACELNIWVMDLTARAHCTCIHDFFLAEKNMTEIRSIIDSITKADDSENSDMFEKKNQPNFMINGSTSMGSIFYYHVIDG